MRILYATDGEPAARDAASLLVRIGRRIDTTIDVTSVNSFDVSLKEAATIGHYSSERGHALATTLVDEATEAMRDAGFDATGRVVDGDPATAILDLAEAAGSDLIVLGAGKARWAESLILGSVSTSVLHAARCSVLVAHLTRTAGEPRALVSTDGSEGARRAHDVFAALADPARCAVTTMSVAKRGGLPDGAEAPMDDELSTARAYAESCAASLTRLGFRTEVKAAAGHPARALLAEASAEGCDLIVAGARGLGRVRAAVLGSVSDTLVRQAPAALIGR